MDKSSFQALNNSNRILTNIQELLKHGLFQGINSDHISEAKKFIQDLSNQTQAQIQEVLNERLKNEETSKDQNPSQ